MQIMDTTLADAPLAAGIEFSMEDKIQIIRELSGLGVPLAQVPAPADPDAEEWDLMESLRLLDMAGPRIVALIDLYDAADHLAPVAAKLRELGITEVALQAFVDDSIPGNNFAIEPGKNKRILARGFEVLAEHGLDFRLQAEGVFDMTPGDAAAALAGLLPAGAAGTILSDHRGRALPEEVSATLAAVIEATGKPAGFKGFNDLGMAPANCAAAARSGADLLLGSMNGFGERCGPANLCTVIPLLALRLGRPVIPAENVRLITRASRRINDLADFNGFPDHPFVGSHAFTHANQRRMSALLIDPAGFEPLEPERVGNRRRALTAGLSDHSPLSTWTRDFGLELDDAAPEAHELHRRLKDLEARGYRFENAEASFELLVKKRLGVWPELFTLVSCKVLESETQDGVLSETTLKLKCGGAEAHCVGEGDGPIDGMHNALRAALLQLAPLADYPREWISGLRIIDYKVRVIGRERATGSTVRVLIQFTDSERTWSTLGASHDIIQATRIAVLEGYEYAILKRRERGRAGT